MFRGVVSLLSLLALTLLLVSPALAQDNRPNQSQVCRVVINVIVNNEQIQYGEDDVVITGDVNDLSDNQSAIIAQYFDISPTIVQECLQNYEGGGADESGDGADDEDGADADNQPNNEAENEAEDEAGSQPEDSRDVSSDEDDVVDGTTPNKDLPETGGANAGALLGVGAFLLFVGFLAWISRYRSL